MTHLGFDSCLGTLGVVTCGIQLISRPEIGLVQMV